MSPREVSNQSQLRSNRTICRAFLPILEAITQCIGSGDSQSLPRKHLVAKPAHCNASGIKSTSIMKSPFGEEMCSVERIDDSVANWLWTRTASAVAELPSEEGSTILLLSPSFPRSRRILCSASRPQDWLSWIIQQAAMASSALRPVRATYMKSGYMVSMVAERQATFPLTTTQSTFLYQLI